MLPIFNNSHLVSILVIESLLGAMRLFLLSVEQDPLKTIGNALYEEVFLWSYLVSRLCSISFAQEVSITLLVRFAYHIYQDTQWVYYVCFM